MITIDFVKEFVKSLGINETQWEVLYEDVMNRWGDYKGLHLPSFMLGQFEMSLSTIKAYKENPENLLTALNTND